MTIELIKPKLIVTLGKVALDSLNIISNHNLTLKQNVGELNNWNVYNLVPLYHPGPRALIHRSFSKQTSDYIQLSHYINSLSRKEINVPLVPKQNELSFINEIYSSFEKAIFSIITKFEEITYFKLTKLLYLMDYQSIQVYGKSVTGEVYLREKDGPWLPNLKKTLDKYKSSLIHIYIKDRIKTI
ncbi:hypothetical protein ES705_48069 [subsurface metagenome]